MKNIVCFGEVLWDNLPTGKKLGGAPLNVALRVKSLGNKVTVISSIGNDDEGKKLANEIISHGAHIDNIQVNMDKPTSEVAVTLSEKGSATYDIKMPCAWDFIQLLKKDIEIVKSSEAFIYGSLVARNSCSRNTLLEILQYASYKVFDSNLRSPHYTYETITELMNYADFIKFNDDEIFEICQNMGMYSDNIEECMHFISKTTHTKQICVTLGKHGAILLCNSMFFKSAGNKIIVADTVGAGDSFLAALIDQLLKNKTPQKALDFACAVGAIVASKSGANPDITAEEIKNITNSSIN